MAFTRREGALIATAAALVFSRVFGLSLVLPGFRGHYDAAFDAAPWLIGVAFSAYGLTLALMQLPMGLLSDRFGRRPVLLVGSLLFVAGSVGAAMADSVGWLIAARLVQGLGAVGSTAVAAVGETVAPARRTVAMALVGVPAGLGFLLGMMAGPLLSPALGVPGLFWLTAVAGVAAALPLVWMALPRPTVVPDTVAAPLGRGEGALAAAGLVTNFALMTALWFLPDASGRVLVPQLLVAFVIMGVASRLIDRRGWTWQPVLLGLSGLAAAAAATVLAGGVVGFIAGAAFFSIHATLAAVLPSQVSRLAGARGGRGHGIQAVIAYGGTFIAGPVAGWSVSQGGPTMSLMALTTLAGVAMALLWWGLRDHRPRGVGAAEPDCGSQSSPQSS